MNNKLNSKRVAFSLSSVSGIVYLACTILIAIVPRETVKIFRYLFHGIDISKIATTPTLIGTLIGLVEIVILALIAGWLFAKIYNKFK